MQRCFTAPSKTFDIIIINEAVDFQRLQICFDYTGISHHLPERNRVMAALIRHKLIRQEFKMLLTIALQCDDLAQVVYR